MTQGKEAILSLIETWHFRAQKIQRSHYDAAARCTRLNTILSIPVVLVSALAGTSQLASVIEPSTAGLLSLLVAALAGLQIFLGYSYRAARHKIAASQYGAMRRAMEELRARVSDDSIKSLRHEISAIRKQFDALGLESPEAPLNLLKRHGHDPVKRHGHDPDGEAARLGPGET